MNYKADYVEYAQRLRVLEEQFGLNWLERQRKRWQRTGRWGFHAVPEQWHQLTIAAEQMRLGQPFRVTDSIVRAAVLAEDLLAVHLSENYDVCIRPRLAGTDFEKVFYE